MALKKIFFKNVTYVLCNQPVNIFPAFQSKVKRERINAIERGRYTETPARGGVETVSRHTSVT